MRAGPCGRSTAQKALLQGRCSPGPRSVARAAAAFNFLVRKAEPTHAAAGTPAGPHRAPPPTQPLSPAGAQLGRVPAEGAQAGGGQASRAGFTRECRVKETMESRPLPAFPLALPAPGAPRRR